MNYGYSPFGMYGQPALAPAYAAAPAYPMVPYSRPAGAVLFGAADPNAPTAPTQTFTQRASNFLNSDLSGNAPGTANAGLAKKWYLIGATVLAGGLYMYEESK